MTNLGIISDTHIYSKDEELPKKVLDEFSNVDMILHAGDFVSIDAFDILSEIAETVGVRGNMDPADIEFSHCRRIEIEDLKIGLIHNAGSTREEPIKGPLNTARAMGVDVLVYGHTHARFIKKVDDVLLLNPGSPTLADSTGFMTAEISGKKIDVKIFEI